MNFKILQLSFCEELDVVSLAQRNGPKKTFRIPATMIDVFRAQNIQSLLFQLVFSTKTHYIQ